MASKPKPEALTEIEQRFVDAFNGDISKTASLIGITDREAGHIVTRAHVRDAIRNRARGENPNLQEQTIATREDLEKFWTDLINGFVIGLDGKMQYVDLDQRIKGSEFLAKSNGVFSEKRVHTGPNGGPIESVTVHATMEDVSERIAQLKKRKGEKVIDVIPEFCE